MWENDTILCANCQAGLWELCKVQRFLSLYLCKYTNSVFALFNPLTSTWSSTIIRAQLVLVRVLLENFMGNLNLFFSLSIHRPTLQGLHDFQQDPPAGWCAGCGMEVNESGQILCPQCRKEKDNENRIHKPLPHLHPGPLS